ncbi:MAG TPA: vgr related protein [Allosphingosinicella sp.]|nr:vgr related protein [Allosphingosinicella sp.]
MLSLPLGKVRSAGRQLTAGERSLAASLFGRAIDYDPVRIHRRKWFPFQPKQAIMAPDGHLWINPQGDLWSDDYSKAPLSRQALFLHEMTHVWQAQTRGRWYLVLMRHPFCRYAYTYRAGRPFERYGLEQQAEIVRHVFLLRSGAGIDAPADLATLQRLLPFTGAHASS